MSIELRFYRQRYNMDPDYYTGKKGIYLTLHFPNLQALKDEWDKMFDDYTPYEGHWLAGETYSAWTDDGEMVCGGAFDPDDIEIIAENIG
jgi:hypothetical protein